jgi:hypothetical protein
MDGATTLELDNGITKARFHILRVLRIVSRIN